MSTNIEWTRNPDGSKGETWPVVTGCTPVSEGCRNCYAARMAATRLKYHPRYAGLAVFENGKARWTGEVRLNHDVLEQPLHWKKPRRIFVASMGDLFHPSIPFEFVLDVWRTMWQAKQHSFQILTKRPDRMLDFLEHLAGDTRDGKPHLFGTVKVADSLRLVLSNVWLGVSVENQATADERIPVLKQIPAVVRFVSFEPLLSNIIVGDDIKGSTYDRWLGISWAIVGGESGPSARPMNPDWARSLRDQCQTAGVPFFFKQWGKWMGMDYTGAQIAGDGAECFRWSGVPMPPFLPGESIGKNHRFDQSSGASRIGKKRAGHFLDGRTWQEFPATRIPTAVVAAKERQ